MVGVDPEDLKIIEDFGRHFCIVCHKRIAVTCGTPVVHFSGCCVGVDHEEAKTKFIRPLKCHIWCYLDTQEYEQKRLAKPELKLMWDFEDVKKIVEECKNDWS